MNSLPTCRSTLHTATACSVAVLLLTACGGGGGPTAPPLDPPAAIAGLVVESAASGSGNPATGTTVRVRSTGASAQTNAQGRFTLSSVPRGDQTLVFERSGVTAELGIGNIQPGERIDLIVSLAGSTAQLQSMERGAAGAAVTLEKSTNGEDADFPPGPAVPIGAPVEWSYLVTNTGASQLSRVGVTDDQGVAVSCPKDTLAPGASMTCTGSGFAIRGQYSNLGMVEATDASGSSVDANDPSHYNGIAASIDLEKSTQGEDADKAPGPTVPVGNPVEWTYTVLNDGGVDLFNIVVSDDQGVIVTCPTGTLRAGESADCAGSGFAVAGQYSNLGTVTAEDADGNLVRDEDPSHYFGGAAEPLSVRIQADHWNTNWPGSSGTVSAKIQGGDLTAIDTSSILLFETDPLLAISPSNQPAITGNHIRAQFGKAEAFGILVTPQTGETRTVTLSFMAGGALVELEAEIQIVGPAI